MSYNFFLYYKKGTLELAYQLNKKKKEQRS